MMEYKPKFFEATLTITLPVIEADPAEFETFDVEEMKKKYIQQLEEDPLTYIQDADDDESLGLSVEVEIKDTRE